MNKLVLMSIRLPTILKICCIKCCQSNRFFFFTFYSSSLRTIDYCTLHRDILIISIQNFEFVFSCKYFETNWFVFTYSFWWDKGMEYSWTYCKIISYIIVLREIMLWKVYFEHYLQKQWNISSRFSFSLR